MSKIFQVLAVRSSTSYCRGRVAPVLVRRTRGGTAPKPEQETHDRELEQCERYKPPYRRPDDPAGFLLLLIPFAMPNLGPRRQPLPEPRGDHSCGDGQEQQQS